MPTPLPSYLAQPDPLHQSGQNVSVFLLTMGDGDEVWEMFGHAAFWLHDNVTGRDTVFNWGVFNMRAPHFILHFLEGLNYYEMGGNSLPDVLNFYREYNRTVKSQELDLTAVEKDSLLSVIRINALPENVKYRYDYFVDNCSTRPRDILDRLLGGQLRIGADSVTPHSYRWETLRLMQGDKPLALGVDIGLGRPSDKPITMWQEMFLPEKLHDWVATRQIHDASGATHPLVKSERVLFQSQRSPEPTMAPALGAWLWPIGLVIGGLFWWLGASADARGPRIGAAVAFCVWATVCGILGVLVTFLSTVSEHRFAHGNENLLLFNPLWLIAAVLLPMYMIGGRAPRTTRWGAFVLAGLAALALVAHVVMLSAQSNLAIIGLELPATVAIAYAVWRRRAVV
ncbi:MAG TPA: DUF4105 domain-containing protein [Gemmatimonadaceae bacterium]|nr:DUF4105 domain-containing protein [Gemmatimonadaceae bacterium]